jgi:hypothetical protein
MPDLLRDGKSSWEMVTLVGVEPDITGLKSQLLNPLADRAMKKEELIRALKHYGDHKESCGITQVLRDHRAKTDSEGRKIYPECCCGWTELIKKINSLFQMN